MKIALLWYESFQKNKKRTVVEKLSKKKTKQRNSQNKLYLFNYNIFYEMKIIIFF